MADETRVHEEVDERFDYLFNEAEAAGRGDEAAAADSPLRPLKAILLTVEWEINEEVMGRLLDRIEDLKRQTKENPVHLLFLQLLASVGKYVKARKAQAHPDAIRLLNSIFNSMEIVFMAPDMSEEAQKTILLKEVRQFRELKGKISGKDPASGGGKPPARPPVIGQEDFRRMLDQAVSEIRNTIREEFQALRKQLDSSS